MISFLVGGGGPLGPTGAELLAAEGVMADWYAQVERWTGFTADELVLGHGDGGPAEGRPDAGPGSALLAVRHAALAIGVHDVLADRGIHPAILTGFSLGGMTAACLAGALTREDLIRLFTCWDDNPRPQDEPSQAVAVVRLPPGAQESLYHGDGRPGVHLSCDYGPALGHAGHRLVMLSGLRDAVHALAAELPAGTADIMPVDIAYHSPLRRAAAENMRAHIDATPFRDPVLPLVSCLDRKLLATADDVRDFFHRNPVSRLSVVDVFAELRRLRTALCVGLGPALPADFLTIPFPMLNLVEPDDLALVAGRIMELGVELPEPAGIER